MSNTRFLICPQRAYDQIQHGEKKTFLNSFINIEWITQVLPRGKQSIDCDKTQIVIRESFKYEIYFYTTKGEVRWYFDTEKSYNDWIERFTEVYGVLLTKV